MTTMTPPPVEVLRKYSGPFTGMFAHVIQRVTGIALLLYLLLHVHTIATLSEGPAAFDQALAMFKSPLFKLAEIALLGAVILHALNGVRITLIDLGVGHSRQRQIFWALAIGLGAVLFLAGGVPMFLGGVLKKL